MSMDKDLAMADLNAHWATIEHALANLNLIVENNMQIQSRMNVFTAVCKICRLEVGKEDTTLREELFQKHTNSFKNYISSLPDLTEVHGLLLLQEVIKRWKDCKRIAKWFSICFRYLQLSYLEQHIGTSRHGGHRSLYDIDLMYFRDMVLNQDKIKIHIKDQMLDLIQRARGGEMIDLRILRKVTNIFDKAGGSLFDVSLGIKIFSDAVSYYSREALSWVNVEESCSKFLLWSELSLLEEVDRVAQHLPLATGRMLLQRIIEEQYSKYEHHILAVRRCLHGFLERWEADHLYRMYCLFWSVPNALEKFSVIFNSQLRGELLGLDSTHGMKFMLNIVKLHYKYSQYVDVCFMGDFRFGSILQQVFRAYIPRTRSSDRRTVAELLAVYCDTILGERFSGSSAEDVLHRGYVMKMLTKGLELLPYVSDGDLFAESFKEIRLFRFLSDGYVDNSLETIFFTKLEERYGALFMDEMERTLEDILLAKIEEHNFQTYLNDQQSEYLINVKVLTRALYPTQKYFKCLASLPQEMKTAMEIFGIFYRSKHTVPRRSLKWVYSLGTCYLIGRFGFDSAQPMELAVTTSQACVLLLFNESDNLTFSAIKSRLQWDADDVKQVLDTLSDPRHKILDFCQSAIIAVGSAPECYYHVNTQYTNERNAIDLRITIVDFWVPTVNRRTRNETQTQVKKDRRYKIQLRVMQIAKQKKVVAYDYVVRECMQYFGRVFVVDRKMVKLGIESLLAREILERDRDASGDLLRWVEDDEFG